MPKSVCKTCARKVDEYHSFRQACVQAEIVLESNLKDQQPSAFPLEPEVRQIVIVCKSYILVFMYFSQKPEGRLEDVSMDGKINLKWI